MKTILNNHIYLLNDGKNQFFALSHFEPWILSEGRKGQLISFILSISRGNYASFNKINYATLDEGEQVLLTQKYQLQHIGEFQTVCKSYFSDKNSFENAAMFEEFVGSIK